MNTNNNMNEEIAKNMLKTGTVNIGIVCKDGIVLAADRKISYGGGSGVSYVGGEIKKIVEVNDKIILSMAGTASDAVRNISILRAELRIKELRTKRRISVREVAAFTSNMLFQNIRTPSMIPSIAHFLLAGNDEEGTHLFDISPDGYLKKVETCVSSGSGMLQADPILDSEYQKGISIDEGIKLAVKCIRASTGRDPAVGLGLDVYVIKKDKIEQVLDKRFIYDLKD
ncbi:MAG: hypothetical protein AABX66_03785 [Nanoarchaeota archaeon]